jgi:transposase
VDETTWAEVHRLSHNEKLKNRAIARRLGIHRETVKLALDSDHCPTRSPATRGSLLDPYAGDLEEILKRYPKLSGVRIFEKLRDLGYSGKITIVRELLAEVRPRRKREAFLKRETLPGVEAQADWGSCGSIVREGVIRPLSVFVMALSFSRLLYVEFTTSQEMEDFLRCHVNAFRAFGNLCPKVILYDNLKSVVIWRQKRLMRLNARFTEFACAYLFEPRPCNPGKGNEKPRAETGVRYVKQNFLAGREFRDFTDLQSQAFHWLRDTANVRFHDTTGEKPIDRFEREKNLLQQVPLIPYDTRICRPVGVNHQARVLFQCNTYSVPPELIGMSLTLKAAPDRVTLYHLDREVAAHVRSYSRYKDFELPAHAEAILATKKNGRIDKDRDTFLGLGQPAQRFLEGLVHKGQGSPDFHIDKLLYLTTEYGATQVLAAMETAAAFGAFSADSVQNILYQRLGAASNREKPNPVVFTARPELANQSVEDPDLNDYSHLTALEESDDPREPHNDPAS